MTLDVPQPSPAHRAALTLHALPENDRAWVLEALPADQQSILHPLLRELEEIGIPRDAGLLDACEPNDGEVTGSAATALPALEDVDVHRLAGLLAAEPPRVAAALLAGGKPAWREHLLAVLPVALAREVRQLACSAPAAAALQAAIVAETARCLAIASAAAAPGSRWQALRRRLTALGRVR